VRLDVGVGVKYLGVVGSTDLGGPAMPEGTAFVTPEGAISCESSSRGISCTDVAGGSSFVIGDQNVVLHNP
jgi:hypothetical protein